MWKFNKFSVIFSLLFLSLLACFSPLTQLKANAIESYKISAEQERTFKRSIYQAVGIPESQNVDIHYYFYTKNNYAEDISLIVYSCDYYDYNTNSVAKKSGCGLYMVQEGGYFKINLISSASSVSSYSRRTNSVKDLNSLYSYGDSAQEIDRFTDEDFNKGLTLLGGTTLRENSWNRGEGGFLLDPVGGNSGGSSSGSNNSGLGLDFASFIKDILNGITEFFRPMMDSVKTTTENVSKIPEFLFNIPEMLGDFIKQLFEVEPSYLNNKTTDFKTRVETKLGTIGNVFSNVVGFFQIFASHAGHGVACNHSSIVITKDALPISFDMCKVPNTFLILARTLLVLAIMSVVFHRFIRFFNILLGSRYVWSLSKSKGEDE